jgi:hypothetical protein
VIDIVTYTKPVRKPRRPKLQLPLADVVDALDRLAAYTPEPRDIAEFASLLRAMGPVDATEYLLSRPPMAAWVDRLLSKLPAEMRVIGTGIGVVIAALHGKAVLS